MADADIDGLSLKELKALITSASLSFADCIDKADLRARAKEAQAALQQAQAAAPPTPQRSQRNIAGYECTSDFLPNSVATLTRGSIASRSRAGCSRQTVHVDHTPTPSSWCGRGHAHGRVSEVAPKVPQDARAPDFTDFHGGQQVVQRPKQVAPAMILDYP